MASMKGSSTLSRIHSYRLRLSSERHRLTGGLGPRIVIDKRGLSWIVTEENQNKDYVGTLMAN